MITPPPQTAKELARESARLARAWEYLAPMIPKRRFLVFGLWISNEHGAVTLASALAGGGFQSPEVSPKRRWFRRGWHVAAASRVDPDVNQATVTALMEHFV